MFGKGKNGDVSGVFAYGAAGYPEDQPKDAGELTGELELPTPEELLEMQKRIWERLCIADPKLRDYDPKLRLVTEDEIRQSFDNVASPELRLP